MNLVLAIWMSYHFALEMRNYSKLEFNIPISLALLLLACGTAYCWIDWGSEVIGVELTHLTITYWATIAGAATAVLSLLTFRFYYVTSESSRLTRYLRKLSSLPSVQTDSVNKHLFKPILEERFGRVMFRDKSIISRQRIAEISGLTVDEQSPVIADLTNKEYLFLSNAEVRTTAFFYHNI